MPDELAKIREQYGDDLGPDERYFRASLLRGRWTELHTGDWWDGLECAPRYGAERIFIVVGSRGPKIPMEKLER